MSVTTPATKIVRMKVADLKAAGYNPRRIDSAAMAGLTKSVERFGLVQPIIVNERSGKVVGGHQRLKVLRASKVRDTDVVIVDLSPIDEKALNVALNNPALAGEFTDDLQAILEEIGAADESLFADLRLGDLLAEIEAKPDFDEEADDVPDVPTDAVTTVGDVWTLGRHRLICGDATSATDLATLMQGEVADLCFTSPPYNAGKSEALTNNTHTTDNKYQGGYDDDQDQGVYLGLLTTFTKHALATAKCVCVNIQVLAGNKLAFIDYQTAFRDHFVDIAVWDKGQAAPQMAKGVMANRFENLVFLSPEKYPSRAIPGAPGGFVPNVYEGPPQQRNEFAHLHAATFPVHLPTWVVTTFTRRRAVILDPFGGTGTTLVACEFADRRARLCEIDPLYCDVTAKRFATLTGKPALLNGKEHTFG